MYIYLIIKIIKRLINIQIFNININIYQKFIILFFLNFQYFNIMIFCIVLYRNKIENIC